MITVLTCNGWSAVYDATGKRVGEWQATNVADALRALGLTVDERDIPAIPDIADFPNQITAG